MFLFVWTKSSCGARDLQIAVLVIQSAVLVIRRKAKNGSSKIISWNVRGLGGLEKRKEVRKLVVDLSPFILCLQETKLQTCDDVLSSNHWGNSSHAFSYRPSVGASGGLLTLWDTSEVEVWSTVSCEHVLWCHGRFTKNGEDFFVANVYAPCEDGAKQGLWVSFSARIQSLGRRRICVCGDFNAVKHIDERRSSRGGGLSDHCCLVLSTNEEEWGPRPSRMFKCWRDVPGYNRFVRDNWNSLQVEGWGGFVLKGKFKMIKATLRDWRLTHVQNFPSRIECLKTQLSTLDLKGEEEVLSDEEIAELHGVTFDLHSLSRMNASISWQHSRALWLKEGDANSKYFHSILASHRRRNALSVIKVDDVTLEGVTPIRQFGGRLCKGMVLAPLTSVVLNGNR
ncbi:hypothetical protein TSUD_413350 [Trifolium subterraneum]|uniref:Endonuclease/exonuclease/phosphatase domain-containing protein n=1 Tax=Trifolium subterraneum TaxID=3900 RepID=A0A2Z6PKS6_TRISU|nr:hypothetical protein TSUD_413350 [Trifolium subterraneum]